MNAGAESGNDPNHDAEVYGVPVVIGSNLITQVVGNLWVLNRMIEIRKHVRVQFWRAMYSTAALVVEMGERD